MRIGEIYRYARPYDSQPEEIDGRPNYFYVTHCPDSTHAVIDKGINPMAPTASAEGLRRPAILISSSPHKIGSRETPWQDFFDVDNGHIRYYGDNKGPGRPAESTDGNKLLLDAFRKHNSFDYEVRRYAPPLVFFRRVSQDGRAKGFVQFQGYGVVQRAQLVTQYDRASEQSFTNFVFDFLVLSLQAEHEVFDWGWIAARRSSVGLDETLALAPHAWKNYLRRGPAVAEVCRRRAAKLTIEPASNQRPQRGSREEEALTEIRRFYEDRKARFEGLAATVTERVLEDRGGSFHVGWLTPPVSDGGADFVGRLDVGSGFSRAKLVVLGQAKCEKPDRATGGNHIARTIARLKRGWIGVYVTTSYFSEAVQTEVIEDEYPLVMIHGLRLVEEVLKLVYEKGYASVTSLLEDVDRKYADLVMIRRPEEILLE